MDTLEEIKSAADRLSLEDKQQLLLAVARSLRANGNSLPPPRLFNEATLSEWIAEDERGMRDFRDGK